MGLLNTQLTHWERFTFHGTPNTKMTSQSNEDENDKSLLSKAAQSLFEHFDSVVIIATKIENGGTSVIHVHAGNQFASIAAADWWVQTQMREMGDGEED